MNNKIQKRNCEVSTVLQDTIISGVISGVIASIVFYFLIFAIRPRFIISKKICRKQLGNGKTVHMIKVANITRSILTNIEYSLEYCTDGADDIKKCTVVTPIEKIPIININKYSLRNTDYAVRLSYDIDDATYPLNDTCYFIFTFRAYHSFSNTMKIKKVTYRNGSIQDGIFETGKSTKILSS